MEQKKMKLMNHIWSSFIISLPVLFETMRTTETSFKQLKDMLEDFHSLRNKYLGYNLANSPFVLEQGGEYFTFYLRLEDGNSKGEFHLWFRGSDSLCQIDIEDYNTPPTKEFVEEIEKAISIAIEGKIPCSGCGTTIKRQDRGGRYFTGIYCKSCWERKWKAIAAKETYN